MGVGNPYSITVSIFGGTAPAIALYFKSLGHEEWFYYYLSGIILLSLIIYLTMRDTKQNRRCIATNREPFQRIPF